MKKRIDIYIPFKGTMITIGVGIGILIVFGLVGNMEFQDAKYDEQLYCKMRDAWERERRMGIPAEQRNGVPNYRLNLVNCSKT
tara:strand:+ start:382 stop:630 length:249 start_codon:yes stop_codon:yes gene_type:complete